MRSLGTMSETMTCNTESRLKGLAPELRNTIAELALATDREDGYTDISEPWPPITHVDTQMRAETYGTFLATTDFVAHVKVRNGSFDRLLRWLDILGNKVHLIKSLTIVHEHTVILPFSPVVFGEDFGVIGLWTFLGAQLQQRGLTAPQLRLPNSSESLPTIDFNNNMSNFRPWVKAVVFHRHYLAIIARGILKPLGLLEEDQIQRAEAGLLSLVEQNIPIPHILNYIVQCSDSNINTWLNIHEDWQLYASLADEQEKETLLTNQQFRDRSDYTRWVDLLNQ